MNVILTTAVIVFFVGFVALLYHKSLVRRIIDIEIMTLSSVCLLLGYNNISSEFLTILVIITASELSLAILFIVNWGDKNY